MLSQGKTLHIDIPVKIDDVKIVFSVASLSLRLCDVARRKPATTYDNTLRDLGARYVKGYTDPSVADFFKNVPFAE